MEAVNIIQGGKKTFTVRLVDKISGDPYDLTGLTAATTCFENADGTELMLALGTGLSVIDALLGKIQVSLTAAQTTLLRTLNLATLEVALTFGGDPVKAQIPDAYNVVQTVC